MRRACRAGIVAVVLLAALGLAGSVAAKRAPRLGERAAITGALPTFLRNEPVGCVWLDITVSTSGKYAIAAPVYLSPVRPACLRYASNGSWILRKVTRWKIIWNGSERPKCSLGFRETSHRACLESRLGGCAAGTGHGNANEARGVRPGHPIETKSDFPSQVTSVTTTTATATDDPDRAKAGHAEMISVRLGPRAQIIVVSAALGLLIVGSPTARAVAKTPVFTLGATQSCLTALPNAVAELPNPDDAAHSGKALHLQPCARGRFDMGSRAATPAGS